MLFCVDYDFLFHFTSTINLCSKFVLKPINKHNVVPYDPKYKKLNHYRGKHGEILTVEGLNPLAPMCIC